MSNQVFYESPKITITDQVLVTKNRTYQMSNLSGLWSKFSTGAIAFIIFAVVATLIAASTLDPIFVLVASLSWFALIFLPKRKLIITLTSGNNVVLFSDIGTEKALEIMHAFTLAKNS